jgi:hypothetical protein
MGVLNEIVSKAAAADLKFVVIGGMALVFHGYSRDTADLDLLIRRDELVKWTGLFKSLGYDVLSNRHAFVQLTPPPGGAWPIDFMLVDNSTFDPVWGASKQAEMYGAAVHIPALKHLVAMKLHALKHGHAERFLKDFTDVENLARINHIDLNSDEWKHIFLKYGTFDLYEKFSRFTKST